MKTKIKWKPSIACILTAILFLSGFAGCASPPSVPPDVSETSGPVATEPIPTEESAGPETSAPVGTGSETSASSAETAQSTARTTQKSGGTSAKTTQSATGSSANWTSTYVGTAQQEEASKKIAKQIADSIGSGTDLERVQKATDLVNQYHCKQREDKNVYMTAYSVFFLGESCCWGYTSALGMVLDCMGYTWRRGNNGVDKVSESPNAMLGSKHQWVIVKMDGHEGYADAQTGYAYYGPYGGSEYTFLEAHGVSARKTVITAPTCTEKGTTHYSCSICGTSAELTESSLGHDGEKSEVVSPTESVGGYTLYTCKRCGYTYTGDYVYTTKFCHEIGRSHTWDIKDKDSVWWGKCTICGIQASIYLEQFCDDGSGNHYWMVADDATFMKCYYCRLWLTLDKSVIHDAPPSGGADR